MSRTYRRRKDSLPDWVTHIYKYSCVRSCYVYERVPREGKDLKKEVAKWRSESGWHSDYGSCPMHWIHDMHEVTHRAQTKNKLKKITVDNCEEIDINPIFKKPHIYFW